MNQPKYAKQCWNCDCAGICFQWLELAGDITREGQPIMPGKCGEIRRDPEAAQLELDLFIRKWKERNRLITKAQEVIDEV